MNTKHNGHNFIDIINDYYNGMFSYKNYICTKCNIKASYNYYKNTYTYYNMDIYDQLFKEEILSCNEEIIKNLLE